MRPLDIEDDTAVRLFVERVRDVQPEFRLTAANGPTVKATRYDEIFGVSRKVVRVRRSSSGSCDAIGIFAIAAFPDLPTVAEAGVPGYEAIVWIGMLAPAGTPREIVLRHRLPHFGHLFASSGYAAGYYVYMWAEVLDADGSQLVVEIADSLRQRL